MEAIDRFCETLQFDFHRSGCPILPDGCKYYCEFPCGTNFVIIEQKPQVRTIEINELGNHPDIKRKTATPQELDYFVLKRIYHTYRLAFPYVIFVVMFHRHHLVCLKVYYRNASLTSLHDDVFETNFPNIQDNSGCVCLGEDFDFVMGPNKASSVHQLLSYFWGSKFTCDYMRNFIEAGNRDAKIKTIKNWAEATRENPNFILGVNWMPMKQLRYLLDNYFPRIINPDDLMRILEEV